ncbi:MAG: hypothetical protein QME12_00150 [Nanoarchaeota archaeon]|nr:hypothetical protein [Nanoarchaeota archaeon]
MMEEVRADMMKAMHEALKAFEKEFESAGWDVSFAIRFEVREILIGEEGDVLGTGIILDEIEPYKGGR